MRRLLLALGLVLAILPAATAGAHPLGNFSVNHLVTIAVASDRIDVRYILDQAEIPTFQERGLPRATILARKRAEVARGLALSIDGTPRPLVLAPGGELTYRPGQGGLPTTRVVLRLSAPVRTAHTVVLHDETYPGRVGWKAIQPVPGAGTAVHASVSGDDPTRGLTTYPRALLSSPSDVRAATLTVAAGAGTVTAPGGRRYVTTSDRSGGTAGFAALLDRAGAGRGVVLLLLLAAFGWGALHALSPGHGKSMVAAYLVGSRGRPRDALLLGVTVTVAHTAGVFGLGLVTLALSATILPEDLYPWLNLASGVVVVLVGARVARARAREARAHQTGHGHHHDHHHHVEPLDRRGLLAMGAGAGLIPCPTALVVLLGAISQHRVPLGLTLIVAFSAGLATTLTVLGILVVRLARLPAPGRVAAILPAISAAAIVLVGVALTVQAIPNVIEVIRS
jgi:ABC-type nickel/cobalt efflux system permease component RcnA